MKRSKTIGFRAPLSRAVVTPLSPAELEQVAGGDGQVLVTSSKSRTSYMADPACGPGGVDPEDYS